MTIFCLQLLQMIDSCEGIDISGISEKAIGEALEETFPISEAERKCKRGLLAASKECTCT
jgi:hypothetical protein